MSLSSAVEHKDAGNAFLKENRIQEAVDEYSKAIAIDSQNPVFFSNRAHAHIRLENYGLALQDCDSAIALDGNMTKAHYRRGVALMAMVRHKDAQASFRRVLASMPNDKLTRENLKQCTDYLRKRAFEQAIAGDSRVSILNSIDYEGIQIESSWSGPSLEISATKTDGVSTVEVQGINNEYLQYMIQHFKDGKTLPKKHVLAIVNLVHQILAKEKTMVEVSLPHSKLKAGPADDEIIVDGASTFTVVGDTHGQFYDVLHMFEKFGYVGPDHVYLFNGDFVDRGSWSCEVALLLYVLKIIFPRHVYINRGNHETNDMNKTYGFADECEHKYLKKVFEAFAESFAALPLATLINQSYLCMHGGLFSDDKITLADIKAYNRMPLSGATQPPREGIAMELLWTDPQPQNGRAPSKRGLGLQFGPDITERFCLQNKIRKVLRSHEVRMGGYEQEHAGRLMTVFSAPNYCDSTGNLGAVIHFTENKDYNETIDNGEGYRDANDPNCPWNLDPHTFEASPHPEMKPMAYLKGGFGF